MVPALTQILKPFSVLCAMPTSIENATFSLYSNNTYAGAIVTYTCKDGYAHVSGDLVRGCTETGTWSGTLPTCLGNKIRVVCRFFNFKQNYDTVYDVNI